MNVPIGICERKIIITIETIFRYSMVFVLAMQQCNEVEVSGGVCDVVYSTGVLETPQNPMGRHDWTEQAVHCELFSLHHM